MTTPGILALNMRTVIASPGFISRVREFGVTVARSLNCGLGGPVGTPSRWMKPKLTGSGQFGLQLFRRGALQAVDGQR